MLLIFFNPRCGFCTRMAPALAALPAEGGEEHALPLLLSTGDPEENCSLVAEHGLRCPVLLLFSDPRCGPCNQVMPELEQFHRRTGEAQVLVVSRGTLEANRAKAEEVPRRGQAGAR